MLRFSKPSLRRISTTTLFSPSSAKLSKSQLKKISTPDLLSTLGFIKHPHAGLTNYLPLGLSILNNISSLLRKHLNANGAIEVSLTAFNGRELWSKTGRWDKSEELYKIDSDFLLQPTAEEEITELVNGAVGGSYKRLPVLTYQITRKYRREKRPRGGLLRGREFLMKDAYSFDVDADGALKSFEKMNECYLSFFTELGLPFVKANADSGDIGGDLSYEWHFVSPVGEDTLFKCDECGVISNIERIERVVDGDGGQADKAGVCYRLSSDGDLVVIYYPEDRVLNLSMLKDEDIVELDDSIVDDDKVLDTFKNSGDSEFKNIIRVMDEQVKPGTLLPDLLVPYSRSRVTTFQDLILTDMQTGDSCASCNDGKLRQLKGIEVGHTFYLGKRYSEPLDGTFIDQNGDKQFYEMGCYGIGVSRLIGSIAEVMRDDVGLRWPVSIAPVHMTIVKTLGNEDKGDEFLKKLGESNVKFDVDDSEDVGLGLKLQHSKRIGIPLQCIIGKNYPIVEIEVRGKRWESLGGNANSFDYLKLHEEKGVQWSWEIENGVNGEKHLVDVKYADFVVKSLLKDL